MLTVCLLFVVGKKICQLCILGFQSETRFGKALEKRSHASFISRNARTNLVGVARNT
jgi:hypothetical protein